MGIESFEVSTENKFGDLLTRKKIRKIPKVGFFAGGFFEYWRMYPETLRKQVEKDMQLVADNLKKDFDLVYPGLVDTLDRAEEVGKVFEKEKIDLLILSEATYSPDYMSVQALQHIPRVPLIIFVPQSSPIIDPQTNYEETLRNSGLIGLAQLTGAFKKMGWYKELEVVVGAINDEKVYQRIKDYARLVGVCQYLRDVNIGVIGHVFRGMYDFEYDKTKIKGKLGPNIINIQISHLLGLWQDVPHLEAEKLAKDIEKRFTIEGINHTDVFNATRMAIAMQKVVEKFRLDALCYLGQHYTEAKTGSTAYLGSSLLHEKGVMVTSEGDVNGLIMMIIMRYLTGITPFFGEWGGFDEEKNALLIMHHGFGDPTLARSSQKVRITATPEKWGYKGNGFSFQFTGKPGRVTIGHFIEDVKGWRMLISGGEVLDLPALPCREITLQIKMDKSVKEFIEALLKKGFSHHAIIVYGDIRKQLGQIAGLMGVEKCFI